MVAGEFMVFGVVFFQVFFADAPGEMAAFGALFAVVWFAIAGTICWRAYNAHGAPVVRHLACVLDVRSIDRHSQHDHGAQTRVDRVDQQVVLELEDGRRLALGGVDTVVATLVQDDIGVAYVKGQRLVGFRRLAS